MPKTNPSTVCIVGSGALATLLATRLADAGTSVDATTRLVLVAGGDEPVDETCTALASGATVVDLLPRDPAESRNRAEAFAVRSIAFVDAPLHAEHLERFPEDTAFFCSGDPAAVADVMPLLEGLGAKVVACGDAGAGQAMRAIVAAVAVCNRLVTYECAAMGAENGLTVADIGSVLNRCSGANSATARVLPAMAAGTRTADATLDAVAAELALCTRLARHVGAPALIANQAAAQVLAASRTLGSGATLDDLRRLVEQGSDIRFTA